MNKTILLWCFTSIAVAFVECSIVRLDSKYDIQGKFDLTANEVKEKDPMKSGKTKTESGKSFYFFLKIKFVCNNFEYPICVPSSLFQFITNRLR